MWLYSAKNRENTTRGSQPNSQRGSSQLAHIGTYALPVIIGRTAHIAGYGLV